MSKVGLLLIGNFLFLQTQAHLVKLINYDDGIEVSDDRYLKSLPSQTVIVALEADDRWVPSETGRFGVKFDYFQSFFDDLNGCTDTNPWLIMP